MGPVANGDLVVVDMKGRVVAETLLDPARPHMAYEELRYVESVQWVGQDNTLVALIGSINPTTSTGYIVDLTKKSTGSGGLPGDNVREFRDDASSASFSADGSHVASVSNMSHFYDNSNVRPTLAFDGGPEFYLRPEPYTIVAPLTWSPDSGSLATIVRDTTPSWPLHLVVVTVPHKFACLPNPTEGRPEPPCSHVANPPVFRYIPIPLSPARSLGAAWNAYWAADGLYLVEGSKDDDLAPALSSWHYAAANASVLARVDSRRITVPSDVADDERSHLFADSLLLGPRLRVTEADIWCGNPACGALAHEPRRMPPDPSGIYVPEVVVAP